MNGFAHEQIIIDAHNAVETIVRDALPPEVYVAAYPKVRKKLSLPCALVEFADTDASQDPATEELEVVAHWNVVCVVAPELKNSEMLVRQFAATVASAIRKAGRVAVSCIAAFENIHFSPDELHPDLFGYDAWTVSFRTSMRIGDSAFAIPEDSPKISEIWLGFAPEIGAAHEQDYEQVVPND